MESDEQLPPGGDQNRGYIIIVVNSVLAVLCSITIALRIYTRTRKLDNIGPDDYTILAAWVLVWVNFACHIAEVVHGLGRHAVYLPISSVVMYNKIEYTSQVQNILAVTLTKISATLFLLRVIARGATRRTRWPLYILMALLVIIAVITIVADSVQCIPLRASWDPRVKGKCLHPHQVVAFGYALGAFTIFTDVVCAAFPVLILRKLQMNRRKKIALSFVMSMGLLTAACCGVKLSYLGDIKASDSTWGGLNVDLWAMIEQDIGVIACSIPALYPLIKSSLSSKVSGNEGVKKTAKSYLSSLFDGKIAKVFGLTGHNAIGSKSDRGSVSEERILPSRHDNIRKTTDIHLDFVSREPSQNKDHGVFQGV